MNITTINNLYILEHFQKKIIFISWLIKKHL